MKSLALEGSAMPTGTNLFEFAPRELSQSAFWAWVLQSTDPAEENLVGVARVGEELLDRVEMRPPRNSIEVDTEHTLENDGGRPDIYAEIDGEVELLIEHKVSAGLRPEQLTNYEQSVDETVRCVFLSTSYSLQKKRSEDGFAGFGKWKVLDAERLLDILEATAFSHPVVVDYQAWLRERVNERQELEERALSETPSDRQEALDTVPGQWRLMEYAVQSFSGEGRQHTGRDTSDGSPYTQFRFVENTDDRDALFYRVESLSGGPVFRLKQWQGDPSPSWLEKERRRDELRTLWRECLDAVGTLDWAEPRNWGKQSSAVARLNLLDYTAAELAEELAKVHPAFVDRVEEKFGWPVGEHEYSYECRECGREFTVEQTIAKRGSQVFPPVRCPRCAG